MMLIILLLAASLIPRDALVYRDNLIREARFVFGLGAPVPLMAGQVHQESGWRAGAKSAYASGLTQFTPSTAQWISKLFPELGTAAPLNPQWAIRAMVTYDNLLYKGQTQFDSECDRWAFSLSDYNGGGGRRRTRQRLSAVPGNFTVTSIINPGISEGNQRENQEYPRRILGRWQAVYKSWGGRLVCEGRESFQ